MIISEAGRVADEDERFRDPRSKTTFKFDHLRLVRQTLKPSGTAQLESHGSYVQEASDSQPYEPDEAAEPFRYVLIVWDRGINIFGGYRAALETAALAYITDHFQEGVVTVFANSATNYVIQFVANKYNPLNYW